MNRVYHLELHVDGPILSVEEKIFSDFHDRVNKLIEDFRKDYGSKCTLGSTYYRKFPLR